MSDSVPGAEDVFLVLVTGKPGRESDYRRWFVDEHMGDVCALPGVRSAHPYTVAQSPTTEQAELCALYEFVDGPAVLQTIGVSKGTSRLPHSEDQGPMTWRLFQTMEGGPAKPLPAGVDIAAVLLRTSPEAADVSRFIAIASALQAEGASYVRGLRLSPVQPARGSEYGVALLVAWERKPANASTLVDKALDQGFPGVSRDLLLIQPTGTARS